MDDKLTIMLIEDDPEACGKIINEIAQNESFAIVGVTNNSERAMQCIKDMQPDCAVLDMDCAGSCESLEFLKKLKKAGAAPTPTRLPYATAKTNLAATQRGKTAQTLYWIRTATAFRQSRWPTSFA